MKEVYYHMKKNNTDIDFEKIFKGKNIPILTLDQRWYEIFRDYDKPSHIKGIEDKLNALMQRQGKLISDIKSMKILKTKFMQEIITLMGVSETETGRLKTKKLDSNQKMIKDINEKSKRVEEELIDIPYKIKAINEQLIIESSKECYHRLGYNNQKIADIAQWITKMRDELKEKILLKQDMEIKNAAIYSYMHDMLGHELLQDLDENLKNE